MIEIAYVHPDVVRQWQRAALLKDRSRREIRERLIAGEPIRDIARDYELPAEFIEFLGAWQMFGDAPQPDPTPLKDRTPADI